MTLSKFIKECTKEDSPLGDLANDILRDTDFPIKATDEEIFNYLDFKTMSGGTNETFREFKEAYLKSK